MKSTFGSLFKRNPFDNKWLNLAFIVSGALLLGVILIPGINQFFDVHPMNGYEWGIVMAAAFSLVIICEIVKWLFRVTKWDIKFKR